MRSRYGYLDGNLGEKYREALDDPNRLELNAELALVDAHLRELLESRNQRITGEWLLDLHTTFSAFKTAIAKRDEDGQRAALYRLEQLITEGATEAQIRAEIGRELERRRRFTESERKRLVEDREKLEVIRFMGLMANVMGVIKENVSSPEERNAIIRGIAALLGPTATSRIELPSGLGGG